MVTISFYYNLCALGLRTSPSVWTLKDTSRASLMNECIRLGIEVPEHGYVLNFCETVWVLKKWLQQDNASERAKVYLADNSEEDSVGEYLLANTLYHPPPEQQAHRHPVDCREIIPYIPPPVMRDPDEGFHPQDALLRRFMRAFIAQQNVRAEPAEVVVAAPELAPIVVKQHRSGRLRPSAGATTVSVVPKPTRGGHVEARGRDPKGGNPRGGEG
jgi:hypothetical protein